MSVTRTTFVSTTIPEMQAEMYEWLTANAGELFDDISKSGSGSNTITCKKDGREIMELLKLVGGLTQHYEVYNMNDSDEIRSHARAGSDECLFHSAYKTSKGIALVPYEVNDSTEKHRKSSLFVSTDEDGSLMIAGRAWTGDSSSADPKIFIMSPEHENAYITRSAADTTCMKSEKTTFCEVLSLGGRKAPHLFYLPFTQYVNETAEIYDGSKWYVTDGFFALEE